jgi:hypothetical protein
MINDTKFRRVYIAVFEFSTDVEPNLVIVGDYENYPEFRWTTYNEGSNKKTHQGIRAACFFQRTNADDGSKEVFFGNTDDNGQFYKMNDGESDEAYFDWAPDSVTTGDDLGIEFRVVTRPYDMEHPLVTKLFKNSRIFIEAADDSYSIEICTIYDLNSEEEQCQSFTIPGIGNKWDEHNWVDDAETEADPLIWAGPALAEILYDPHRKAKFMQLVFKQFDKDAPVQLLGWGVSGSIFGPI